MAPLLNASQFPLGDSAALSTLVNSKNELGNDSAPLFQVTAWATCDGIRSHCFKESKVEDVTRYDPSDELASSACYQAWFEPARGLKRKGYNQPTADATVRNSWSTAALNAQLESTEEYSVPLTNFDGGEAKFYGLGIQTVDNALFVEYATDPQADYGKFKSRSYEAVGVLTVFSFLFFSLFAAGVDSEEERIAPMAMVAMLVVLVVATVYRAVRVPGLIPGDAGYFSIVAE
jgi:hypothetical protein